MISWTWPSYSGPQPEVDHKPARDTSTYAQHLRGKVMIGERHGSGPCYYMSVVNTVTGETVSSDDGCLGLERAFEHAEFHTAVARAAWMTGLKQKSLSRRAK
jgi:hypothetical protein